MTPLLVTKEIKKENYYRKYFLSHYEYIMADPLKYTEIPVFLKRYSLNLTLQNCFEETKKGIRKLHHSRLSYIFFIFGKGKVPKKESVFAIKLLLSNYIRKGFCRQRLFIRCSVYLIKQFLFWWHFTKQTVTCTLFHVQLASIDWLHVSSFFYFLQPPSLVQYVFLSNKRVNRE